MSKGSGRVVKSHGAESSLRTPSGKATPQRATVAKAAAVRSSQASSVAAQGLQPPALQTDARGPEQVASAGEEQRPRRQLATAYPKAAPAQPRSTSSCTGPLGPSRDAVLRPRPKAAPDRQEELGLMTYDAVVPHKAPSPHPPPPSLLNLRRNSFLEESETPLRQISGSSRGSARGSVTSENEHPKAKAATRKRPKAKRKSQGTAQSTKTQAFSFSTDNRKTRRRVPGSAGPGDVPETSRVKTLGAKARPKYTVGVSPRSQSSSLSALVDSSGPPLDLSDFEGFPASASNATVVTQPVRASLGIAQTLSYNTDVSPNSNNAASSGPNAAATASTTYANPTTSLGNTQILRSNATVSSSPGNAQCLTSSGAVAMSSNVSVPATSCRLARQAQIDAEGQQPSTSVQLSVLSGAQVGGSSSSSATGPPLDFRSFGGTARSAAHQPVVKCLTGSQPGSPRMVIRTRLSNKAQGSDEQRHVSFCAERNVEVVQFNVEEPVPCTTRVARRVFGGDLQTSATASRPPAFGGGATVGQLNVVTNTVATGLVPGRVQATRTVLNGASSRPGIRDLDWIDFDPGSALL